MSNALIQKLGKKSKSSPALISEVATKLKSDLLLILEEDLAQGFFLGDFRGDHEFDQTEIEGLIAKVNKALGEAIEKSQSPLRVSLIGPFSSGKTVTLNALLNQPNLLPSAQEPTSGNVVEIQIVSPHSNPDSRRLKCLLFSLAELEMMLRDYYGWLRLQLPQVKPLPEKEGFLKQQLSQLRQEMRQHLDKKWLDHMRGSLQPDLVKSLAHLYRLLITAEKFLVSYPHLNLTDRVELSLPYQVAEDSSRQRLKTVVVLGQATNIEDSNPEKLEAELDKLWKPMPTDLQQLMQHCQAGTIANDALRVLFPLYRRIVLTLPMELPEWEVTEAISFLDFPGIDSPNQRDTYLSQKEIQLAHVNILFFLANRQDDRAANKLVKFITDAKTHLTQLHDRLIPVINFFDDYARLPDLVAHDATEEPQQALARVRQFFNPGNTEVGFDNFDKNLLGNLFPGDSKREYFLLSPVAAIDPQMLTGNDKNYRERYEQRKDRCKQLLNDLGVSLKLLANTDVERPKYGRLKNALEGYMDAGGIGDLREKVVERLKINGRRLIAEDARPPLEEAIETLTTQLLDNLPEEVDLDEETGTSVDAQEAKRKVLDLWKQMVELTNKWNSQQRDLVVLQIKDTTAGPAKKTEVKYLSPLEWCQAQVLETVLADEFWQKWGKCCWPYEAADLKEETPLSDLATRYHQMEQELENWTQKALEDTLRDTLTKLDNHPLPLKSGESHSFQELRETLFSDYVDRADGVTSEETAVLNEFFSLSSLQKPLSQRLATLHKQWQEQQGQEQLSNTKVPFNETLSMKWQPEEIMRIQRQMILTLQRRIARPVAFYMSVFLNTFQGMLTQRLQFDPSRTISSLEQEYHKEGQLFDKLAQVPPQEHELVNKDQLSRLERRKKAAGVVANLKNAWGAIEGLLK